MMLEDAPISIFLPHLEGGGAERAMIHLAQGIAQQGFKTDLVLAKVKGAYQTKLPAEVRIINLEAKSPVIFFKTLALRRYLQQERPSFLLSALDLVSAATWAKLLAGVPTQVVMCVQTHLSQQFKDQHQGFGKVRPQLVQWFYPWADAIVAASQGVAEDVAHLAQLPLENIHVIYNPVVTPDLAAKAQEPIDHPWFAPGEPPVLLGVGRLVYQKDFPTLIRAFALVRQQRLARLMILGEGMDRPELEALVRELGLEAEVALPGFVENPYAYMAKATVFVLSSVYEGFGNVVAEALGTGTSVVSTDCESGPKEILENGKYGRLVPVGDVSALAEAILATLNKPIDSEVLCQRAQAFSVEKVAAQYLEVLKNVNAKSQTV